MNSTQKGLVLVSVLEQWLTEQGTNWGTISTLKGSVPRDTQDDIRNTTILIIYDLVFTFIYRSKLNKENMAFGLHL